MSATTPQLTATVHTFTQLLSSTLRGARLARLLAAEQLRAWPVPPSATERAEQIVAELAANAALHGRVNGRDFRLTVTLDTTAGVLRIAVTDARGERIPSPPAECGTPLDTESGRGLLLVIALADRWGVEPYPPGGKTVWAECACEILGPDPHSGRS
ncbi:ATP-binding protein [Streptomyces chartreusis]